MGRLDVFPGSKVMASNAQILYGNKILMHMPLYLDHSQMLSCSLALSIINCNIIKKCGIMNK